MFTKVDASSGGVTEVARLDYAVNALGYSSALGRLVGLTSKGHRWWKNPSHVVLIDTRGVVNDLGPVDAHWFRTDDVSAGGVVGTTFYVRDHALLHAIDIDPDSPSYLKIVRSVVLDWPALTLDDFTADPVTGKLTGVSAAGWGPGEVVTFDPVTGRVLTKVEIAELPGRSTYGAVLIDSAGTVYAINNGYKGRSRVYRITGTTAAELSTGPQMGMIDAAGCLPNPMPPRVEPPAPRPEVPAPPSPPAPPAPVPAPAPAPAPVVPPPAPTEATPPPVAPQQPVPVRAARQKPEPRKELALDPETTPMTKSRKWAMVTVILVMLGAGAAAARARG
ncbi:hypothetical protein DFR72_12189 [Lentzea flaviverrucosa]|uniref:DUF6923 domain-containing protein n=1 Tax=Lentzea flaviverrucosa TaxID=200379 RepID=A0A1H9XX38_9PSEU|nr:hypothetical protein DFR72_12189 [Lentzea flaviverrucosa]SES50674.1 hypothetical protein SAMN05216195_12199 [Lentzea flaviverrucosa]